MSGSFRWPDFDLESVTTQPYAWAGESITAKSQDAPQTGEDLAN